MDWPKTSTLIIDGGSSRSAPCLKSMREKGWFTLGDMEDTRRKQIELTPATLKHFDRLAEAISEAAKGI